MCTFASPRNKVTIRIKQKTMTQVGTKKTVIKKLVKNRTAEFYMNNLPDDERNHFQYKLNQILSGDKSDETLSFVDEVYNRLASFNPTDEQKTLIAAARKYKKGTGKAKKDSPEHTVWGAWRELVSAIEKHAGHLSPETIEKLKEKTAELNTLIDQKIGEQIAQEIQKLEQEKEEADRRIQALREKLNQ